MTKLIRDNRTGDYYTPDKRFQIERGTAGWNVNELVHYASFDTYRYSFSCDTLKEVRESI